MGCGGSSAAGAKETPAAGGKPRVLFVVGGVRKYKN